MTFFQQFSSPPLPPPINTYPESRRWTGSTVCTDLNELLSIIDFTKIIHNSNILVCTVIGMRYIIKGAEQRRNTKYYRRCVYSRCLLTDTVSKCRFNDNFDEKQQIDSYERIV